MNESPRGGAFAAIAYIGIVRLVAGLAAYPDCARAQSATPPPPALDAQKDVAHSLESSFVHVADSVGPATVRIMVNFPVDDGSDGDSELSLDPTAPRPPTQIGKVLGSGVIIRPDGYILTNDHIVEEAVDRRVSVTLSDNRTYIGTVTRDIQSDLAVVKIDVGKPLPFVTMADSSRLRVGQWAIAIGSPFDEQNTVTAGIISALHRHQVIGDERTRLYYDLIQTDAAINPGNSGGPLLNIDGQLIGINVALQSQSRRRPTNSGIGFAIPANAAKAIADQLISKGKVTRATLGVRPSDIPGVLRRQLAGTDGAYVSEVTFDTPADKAGLEPGDIITHLADVEINSEATLRDALIKTKPDAVIPITFVRAGKSKTVSVVLDGRDESGLSGSRTDNASSLVSLTPHKINASALGMVLRSLSTTVAAFDTKPRVQGVLVNNVVPGSPASDAELEPGSIITAVNGFPINSVQGLNLDIAALKADDVVVLTVYLPSDRDRSPSRGVVSILVP